MLALGSKGHMLKSCQDHWIFQGRKTILLHVGVKNGNFEGCKPTATAPFASHVSGQLQYPMIGVI